MEEMLRSLLDISQLDTGGIRPRIKPFCVSGLIGQLQDQYESIATRKGLTLTVMPSNAVVRSDPTLLRVILQNLVSNAIKYTRRGAVVIECQQSGDQLSIEVSDSGIGIPEEKYESIFEEFYQLDNPSRDRNLGAGIGLAIVKRIADLLNHRLSMHSVVGRGSRFAIHAPLADSAQEPAHAASLSTAGDNIAARNGSILLIEDDEIVLDANQGLLKMLGYNVIACRDAESAIQSLESGLPSPDIIICDYRLPGDCDGMELVQRLRGKEGSLIPAIILTGDITIPGENSGLPVNSVLVQKPARVEELTQAIAQLCGNQ
jgi:CheY-like chemotaxis protein/anti-sigma regulatory factor (Ser/Thr protein kinase)